MSEDNNKKSVPFFARYLEGQIQDLSDEEMEAVAGGKKDKVKKGDDVTTMKYPSDSDEDGGDVTTMKYPSDNEDTGEVY